MCDAGSGAGVGLAAAQGMPITIISYRATCTHELLGESFVVWLAAPQTSRTGFDNLQQRFMKEMYDLVAEPGPLAQNGLNNTHLDFAWNVGLTVSTAQDGQW